MFTGIVEEVGRVLAVPAPGHAGELSLEGRTVCEGTRLGDSIAVNGVCLTVTGLGGAGRFSVDIMPETLRRSNLGSLRAGSRVNLERAMAADGRFGGHIVSGHIDGCGRVRSRAADQNAVRVRIDCPRDILRLVVEKGSVAVDGISLTVSRLFDDGFEVSIIPHTAANTTLLSSAAGDAVNLENDVVGKYVQRLLLAGGDPSAGLRADGGCADAGSVAGPITWEYVSARGF